MRAAVIGYNIFAVGGTTQSNLNLLTTLNQHYASTVYFIIYRLMQRILIN